MKKEFRVKDCYDGTVVLIVCLYCKNEVLCGVHPTYGNWKFCPICGVEWEGEFTKRNPRYHAKLKGWTERDYESEGDKIVSSKQPRLIIEGRHYHTPWRLYVHSELGLVIDGVSSSVWMLRKFEKIAKRLKPNEEIRIRLLRGSDSRTIKQRSKKNRYENN